MTTKLDIPDGLLLVDKPCGISSRDVVNRIARCLGKVKAGHCGTLDPMASGLLIIGIGKGTRTMEHLLEQPKVYRAKAQLGIQTDTADLEGEVIQQQDCTPPQAAQLAEIFQSLCGEMTQVAPKYSALKHKGQPFYKLARAGKEVPHRERSIQIYRLQLEELSGESFSFEVECSKGTYIRTLVEDIAKRINNVACLASLQRTAVGHFKLEQTTALDDLVALPLEQIIQRIVPADKAFADLPPITLEEDLSADFCNGKTLVLDEEVSNQANGKVRVYQKDNIFLGIAQHAQATLKPSKVWGFPAHSAQHHRPQE